MALDFPDSPVDGELYEGFVYSSIAGAWRVTKQPPLVPVEFLVIAGGGPGGYGGNSAGGGGGAGGYRETNVPAFYPAGTSFTITIGAGGTAPKAGPYTNGNSSRFGDFTTIGGGSGSGDAIEGATSGAAIGGSGGGGRTVGTLTGNSSNAIAPELGNSGASGVSNTQAGGGGGAGGNGTTPNGGPGVSSSITGSAVGRAGGGGGGARSGAAGVGTDGGGNGGTGNRTGQESGEANTGGGGGGGASNLNADTGGGNGGSGVVIVKLPGTTAFTVGAGLTYSTAISGTNTVYTFTAGTGTVTI